MNVAWISAYLDKCGRFYYDWWIPILFDNKIILSCKSQSHGFLLCICKNDVKFNGLIYFILEKQRPECFYIIAHFVYIIFLIESNCDLTVLWYFNICFLFCNILLTVFYYYLQVRKTTCSTKAVSTYMKVSYSAECFT